MRYCPHCVDEKLRYDASANALYCMECEHVEFVVPRGSRTNTARIKTTRLSSRRTLGRVAI